MSTRREIRFSTNTLRLEIEPWFGDFADDFDVEAVCREYADRLDAAMPEGMTLIWTADQTATVYADIRVPHDDVIEAFRVARERLVEANTVEDIARRHERTQS